MASFSFNFGGDGDGAGAAPPPAPATPPAPPPRPCASVPLLADDASDDGGAPLVVTVAGERFALAPSASSAVVEAGVYEGGAELWECAGDLAAYVAAHEDCRGATVLELGCGRGVPGLWALRAGAAAVVFSDYDADVLERLTRRDVARELARARGEGREAPRVGLYAGDWRSLPAALAAGGGDREFSLILSAETAYRDDTARALVGAVGACLAPGGVALVATKRYYFGCGGGTVALEAALGAAGLAGAVVWSAEDGRSNIRDLLRITRPS